MLAIIIGAGTGISQAVARHFGSKGFAIGLVARNQEKLLQEVNDLKNKGIQAVSAVGDSGNEFSLQAALDQIHAALGPADLILYNASASVYKPIEDETWESITHQMAVNAGGPFHVLKRYLPACRAENKGKLFFTGGGLSLNPQPAMVGLSMGKAAMRNLVLGAANGVKGTGVHIATVTVTGYVRQEDPKYNPDAIAGLFWNLYQQPQGKFETEIIY